MADHRVIIDAVVKAMNTNDFTLYDRLFTEDFVEEYPQSGELIRGPANARWILENYPGAKDLPRAVETESVRNLAGDAMRVMAPTFSVVRIEGGGTNGSVALKGIYPDKSVWWIIVLYQLRGDRICRSSTFFAPEFPPPEWRAGHIERILDR
jgi:hypothetical protein